MADFVNPTTGDLVASVNDMPAPWIVCTRANLLAWNGIDRRYRKWITDHIEEMTAGEKTAADAAILTASRDTVALELDQGENVLRAFMLAVLGELNNHADKINTMLTAVDNATNLADLKTRYAAIADYPTRTAQQLITDVRGKLGT